MITFTPDATPEPYWVAIFSALDLPTARPEIAAHIALYGVPAVVTVDGRPMAMRTSTLVPAGQVYVVNEEPLRRWQDAPLVLGGQVLPYQPKEAN